MVRAYNRRRRRYPTAIMNVLSTGTSRRNQSARAQLRYLAHEIEDRSNLLREVAIARDLGVVDASYARGITGPLSQQHSFPEPLIGSYFGQELNKESQELPCSAHAAYHRLWRYAEEREHLSQ